MIARGALLILLGTWLLLQTLAGGLPARIISYRRRAGEG